MNPKSFHSAFVIFLLAVASSQAAENLVADPSFEEPMEKDRWGHVFEKWSAGEPGADTAFANVPQLGGGCTNSGAAVPGMLSAVPSGGTAVVPN